MCKLSTAGSSNTGLVCILDLQSDQKQSRNAGTESPFLIKPFRDVEHLRKLVKEVDKLKISIGGDARSSAVVKASHSKVAAPIPRVEASND